MYISSDNLSQNSCIQKPYYSNIEKNIAFERHHVLPSIKRGTDVQDSRSELRRKWVILIMETLKRSVLYNAIYTYFRTNNE